MQLAGLGLAQLLALLGAVWALTTALYLLKLRRRAVVVPFIALWESLLAPGRANRLFARLRHVLSLLLALLIVSLLALALGDPRPRAEAASTRNLVVLIDAGLSMQAHDVRPNRLQAAIERARTLVQGAGANLHALVAQMDQSTTPLSAMSAEPRALETALARISPTDLPTDYQRAYRFALDVLRGRGRAEIVVLSDHAADPDPELAADLARSGVRLSYLPFGRRSEDLGIAAFAVRRYPLDKHRSELLVELFNASPHRRTAKLTLLGDGVPIDVQPVTLEPGRSVRRVYDDVTGVSHTLEARLSAAAGSDDLAADDRAYAVLPEQRRVRVLAVSAGNRYLEAALLLDEYLDVDLIAPGAYSSAAGYDAVIFDRWLPPVAPEAPALYIDPSGGGAAPLKLDGTIERPAFEHLQREHPLLRFTALHDVNVASALRMLPQPGDTVVAADKRGPLIVAGARAGRRFVALAFDLRQSDLPLRVAWPLLLLNTLDWFSGPEGGYLSSSDVGQTVSVALPENASHVQVRGPSGPVPHTLREGKLVLTPLRAGFYRVRWPAGEQVLAVNLGPELPRDLRPRPRLRIEGRAAPRPRPALPAPARPPWVWLLLAALLLLTAEWVTYNRRLTV